MTEIIYRDFCLDFCEREITNLDHHYYLQPYISVFKNESDVFENGIFSVEPGGIFRPISKNDQGVVCFSKIPFSRQKVYTLYDGHKSVFSKLGDFYVIFPNVEISPHGYKFRNEAFSSYPISATVPTREEKFYTLSFLNQSSATSLKSVSECGDGEPDENESRFFDDDENQEEIQVVNKYIDDDPDFFDF